MQHFSSGVQPVPVDPVSTEPLYPRPSTHLP